MKKNKQFRTYNQPFYTPRQSDFQFHYSDKTISIRNIMTGICVSIVEVPDFYAQLIIKTVPFVF